MLTPTLWYASYRNIQHAPIAMPETARNRKLFCFFVNVNLFPLIRYMEITAVNLSYLENFTSSRTWLIHGKAAKTDYYFVCKTAYK